MIRNALLRGRPAIIVMIAALMILGCINWIVPIRFTAHASTEPPQSREGNTTIIKVDVVKPRRGGLDRTCVVPGSIHAFEAADLYAKVSGYLEKLNVDIGDRVEEGQLLAEIYSPELHREVDRTKAAVDRAHAQVGQMKSRVVAAQADLHAAETGIARAESNVRRDQAGFEFRDKQFRRFRELVQSKSVDERLADEKEDQRLAAQAALDASQANLAEAKALVASASAKVEQAKADLVDAEAEVEVAQANFAKAKVFAEYTRITAPYNGVITTRAFHRGDFIRAAEQSSNLPLLTIERTDLMRLVLYVPDKDIPFADPADETVTEIDSLPGNQFRGTVSRIAFSEDRKTKTMRTEVDLPNEQKILRNGMYGRTTILLERGNPHAWTIPSTALVGTSHNGKGTVFVVKANKASKTPVTIANDNGVLAEIVDGITADDLVITGNNNALVDGRPVQAVEMKMPAVGMEKVESEKKSL